MIKTEFGVFDGDKWEQVCKTCFYKKFEELNDIYIHVEATPGDDGIEGFTISGKVFQCYCPDKFYSADELHKKLTIKINGDLKKLKHNESKLKVHLGNTKIKTWYLVTPSISKKEIIAYCHKKSNEVINWNLSIIDNSCFTVVVVDIDYIRPFLKSVLEGYNYKTQYNPSTLASHGDISKYKNNESYLVTNANKKHEKKLSQQGVGNAQNVDLLTHKTITHFLDGREILEIWRKDSPKEYEKYTKIIKQEEEEIVEISLFPNSNYKQRYDELKSRIEFRLCQAFNHLDETTIKDLTNYTISDWLLRCPLNFV